MNERRFLLWAGLYLGIVIGAYVLGAGTVEAALRKVAFDQVTKRLVEDSRQLEEEGFLLGMYRPELPYHFGKIYETEDSLGLPMKLISFYQAWGEGPDHELHIDLLQNLERGGFIPFITWEPWLSAFEAYHGQTLDSSLSIIASGRFDAYVRRWARTCTRFGKPMFVRFAHEVSNPWYPWGPAHGNSPEQFVNAWKHVRTIFREEGARNVAFVWCPYTPEDSAYFPGKDQVDWIGLDIFNFGQLVEGGFWMDPQSITRILYNPMLRFGKPIVIAELGCAPSGGNKADWFAEMFQALAQGMFPEVKATVVFDHPAGKAPNGLDVDLAMTTVPGVYGKIPSGSLRTNLSIAERRME